MENIEKLIENEGWLPIEQAPKDGTWVELKGGLDDDDVLYDEDVDGNHISRPVIAKWVVSTYAETPCELANGYWAYAAWDSDWRSEYSNPTHFRYLDTPKRMAAVIKAMKLRLEFIKSVSEKRGINDIASLVDMCMEEVDKIAGGENAVL